VRLSDLAVEAVDRPALLGESRSWTYRELTLAVETLATAIAARQSDARRPIALVFDLVPEAVVAAHAVAGVGSTLALAHTAWKGPERERFADAIQPEIVLSSKTRPWLDGDWEIETLLLPGFGPISVCTRSVAEDAAGLEAPPGTDVALWTSGSGGSPKVVGHSWSGLIANARAVNQRVGFDADSVWLATLAWAHVGGLALIPRAAAAGAALAFGSARFDASTALARLREQRVTHVSLVPAMAHRLIERAEPPPATLRVALVGGAAMPPAVTARAIAAGWPISLTYGMTEAGSQIATASPEESRTQPSCVGLPLANAEIRIESAKNRHAAEEHDTAMDRGPADHRSAAEDRDTAADDSVANIAEPGEVYVRGSGLFLGYLGEPARDPEAWFATGDLGHLDQDGRLRVTGRRSARIVSGGTNVDPLEVEAEIARHPDVRDACVIGVPDPAWGEIVSCVVAADRVDRADLETDLDAWTKQRLSGARVPRRWKIVEALPRTATGKVDRARVRDLLNTDEPDK